MRSETESLLRSALEAAFPERGAALAREIRRWFDDATKAKLPPDQRPKDDGTRPCLLCERPGNAMLAVVLAVPATKTRSHHFLIPGFDTVLSTAPNAVRFCSACLYGWVERVEEYGRDPKAWPHPDMVLTDARRALDAEGSEAAAALMAEIDERSERTAPRRAGTATCDICKKKAVCVSGPRGRACLACVAGAHKPLFDLLAMLSRLR